MPRDPQTLIFVGIKSSVVALDAESGNAIWEMKLVGSDFVTVLWDGQALFAGNRGEVMRLDPRNGSILWHNRMKGYGMGVVSLASSRLPMQSTGVDGARAKRQHDAQQAAAAGAAG
jgi:outer membrane protein assembly factor BamB